VNATKGSLAGLPCHHSAVLWHVRQCSLSSGKDMVWSWCDGKGQCLSPQLGSRASQDGLM